MSQINALTNHIIALVSANSELSAYMGRSWMFTELPDSFPALHADAFQCLDDKQDSWRVNLNFITEDMSIEAFDVAHQMMLTLQRSPVIQTQGLLSRPEPENSRNRFMIPCVVYMSRL